MVAKLLAMLNLKDKETIMDYVKDKKLSLLTFSN